MSEPFLGQITMMGFPFAPKFYALCNGQTMALQQNQALFALLGTYYGGNGTSNFMLPNLQGRSPISAIPSIDPAWQPTPYNMGETLGVETVTLTSDQIPQHTHALSASTVLATDGEPSTGASLGKGSIPLYAQAAGPVALGGGALGPSGSGPHANMQPYLAINMCIALSGIFPQRN